MKPRIAMVLGDPAGIGPELVAKLLSNGELKQQVEILLIADRGEAAEGMRVAGCRFEYVPVASLDDLKFGHAPLLYNFGRSSSDAFVRSRESAAAGRYCLETLKVALDLTLAAKTNAVVFAPLNKTSLHLAGMNCSDELRWFAQQIGHKGPTSEFNVLGNLWTSRVTSHVALKEVPGLISRERILEAIGLLEEAVRRSGVASPRIAVCGLNPHNGDNGNFGREEIETIAPAVAQARGSGLNVEGPFPADTIFLKVQGERPAYDAIVTMYHDQGQIAMKLMGFSRGVTVAGGLPIPITTPAHGTAFDIAGSGRADVGAMRQAFELACRMTRASSGA